MPKTQDDVIQEQVRARIEELLRSRGVDEGRVGIEVLFMLPPEFVRAYRELYEAGRTSGAGVSSVGVDPGRVTDPSAGAARNKAKGARASAGNRTDGRGAAKHEKGSSGGGHAGGLRLNEKGERALELKRLVDRRLKSLVGDISRNMPAMGAARNGNREGLSATCSECGRGQARGWKRCPFHD